MKNSNKNLLPLGSMARSTGIAKVKTINLTTTVISDASTVILQESGPERGLYEGGRFSNIAVTGSLDSLYPSGLPNILQNYDTYKIARVEVYATAQVDEVTGFASNPYNVTVMSSVDHDDAISVGWDVFRTRINISTVSLSNTVPTAMLASFTPRANFLPVNANSPSNVVPSGQTWFDISASQQQFVGLKVHISTPRVAPTRVQIFAKVTLHLRGQV